jgi:putative alpha-1,2-mannosidase
MAGTFLTRARNWQNEFDASYSNRGFTGWLMARYTHDNADGSPDFVLSDVATAANFVEGSAYQYLFLAPHDIPGLIQLLGGDDALTARLDYHFTKLNDGPNSPYFYMGNEPGFEAPWEYPWAGAPYKTHAVINRLINTTFSVAPGGLPGNEDLGAMSSWLVWAMLGLYPEVPGVGGFVLATPTFPRTQITLTSGATFTLLGDNASPSTFYLQSLSLNGQPYTSSWLPLASVTSSGTLEFTLGTAPNMTWGSRPADRPPAYYTP